MKLSLSSHTFKKTLKALCGVGVLFTALSFVYIFGLISELKVKLTSLEVRPKGSQSRASLLEQGSITTQNDLLYFSKFLESPLNLSDAREEGMLSYSGKNVLIMEDIELGPIKGNSCQRYRCLQDRISFMELPSKLWKGLLGIEDYRFLQHRGVDPISIVRAVVADIKAMSLVQGGSTLTQQLAKNLFLTNEKKLERKFREMIYALYLEKTFSKEQIITMYFNEVFWGTVGGIYIKGIGMASRIYFDKSPEQLSDYESSILIGMLKGPYYYHPINKTERLKNRTSVVFKRLKELKLVSSSEQTPWSEKDWSAWKKALEKKNKSSALLSIYLVGKSDGPNLEPYEKFVFYQSVEKVREKLKERTKGVDIGIKSLVIDASCKDLNCPDKFLYYNKYERELDRAVYDERHQVGSSLKPIIYQQLIEEGKSLEDEVSTDPITLKLISGDWTPQDSSKELGEMISLKTAIQKSRNIPLIRASKEVGFEVLEKRLLDYFPNLLVPLKEYPAQLLGAIELSLSELGDAYLKFFQNQCKSFNEGRSSYEDSLLYYLAQADKTTISHAAGSIIKQSLIFGKTGTTNNGLDSWYIAFDGQNFFAIWFGVDSERAGKELRLYGSNSAFAIFQNFIQYRAKRISEFICPNI